MTEQCPICLDTIDNASLLDVCFHKFCYECIVVWIQKTPTCPLCKQPFDTIIHDIMTEQIFMRTPLEKIIGADAVKKHRSMSTLSSTTTTSTSSTRRHWGGGTAQNVTTESTAKTAKRGVSVMSTAMPTSTSARFAARQLVYSVQKRIRPLEFLEQPRHANRFVSDAFERTKRLDEAAQNLGSEKLWARCAPFAERDLKAITSLDDVELIMLIVKNLVSKHNVHRTEDAQKHMAQFFARPLVDIFFTELLCFAASTFDMQTYDRLVTYEDDGNIIPPPPPPQSTSAVQIDEDPTTTNNNNNNNNANGLSPSTAQSTKRPSSSTKEATVQQLPKRRSRYCQCTPDNECVTCLEADFLRDTIRNLDNAIAEERRQIDLLQMAER